MHDLNATNTPTVRVLKLALILGRPVVLIGCILLLIGLSKGPDEIAAWGMLLVIAGFVGAWIGKIGLFWIR